MKMQENEKKGCLIGLSCMIPGIVCWIIGQEFDIYVLIVLGYGAFPYAGSFMRNMFLRIRPKDGV